MRTRFVGDPLRALATSFAVVCLACSDSTSGINPPPLTPMPDAGEPDVASPDGADATNNSTAPRARATGAVPKAQSDQRC